MKNAIESCSNENSSECQNVKKTYGDTINAWCFSDSLVDMSGLFKRNSQFNEDISRWDVSKVTNMAEMFHSATSFNRNIRDWDVSEVRNMNSMFYGATAFEGTGIGNWKEKTRNVLLMSRMFQGATSFNQDIGGWNVSKVRDMIDMFHGATAFNGNIGDWREKTRNVQNMYFMFYGATTFDQDISGWDISKVRDMSAMFQGATSFNQNLCKWNVPNQFPYGDGCNQMFKDSGCDIQIAPYSRFYPSFCSEYCIPYPGVDIIGSWNDEERFKHGKYFKTTSPNAFHLSTSTTLNVKQCRNGVEVWHGIIRVWPGVGLVYDHGRRESDVANGQWRNNDRIVKSNEGCTWDSYDTELASHWAYNSSQVRSEMNVGSALSQGAFGDEIERSDANKEFIIHDINDPAAAHHSLANDDGKDLSLEMEPIDHHEHNNPHLSSVSSFDDVIYFYSGSKLYSTNTYRFVTILLEWSHQN